MRELSVQTPPMHGPDVWALQYRLAHLGYNPGTPDGVYGPMTGQAVLRAKASWLVSPHTETAGSMLQEKAAHRCPYVDPFARATVVVGRIDQGVDYHGTGRILAIGDAEIVANNPTVVADGEYLLYRLIGGKQKGRYVYVAEAIVPLVHEGQVVLAGEPIAYFGVNAMPGRSPGIEMGWGSNVPKVTLAKATTGYKDGQVTEAGKGFARLLYSVGAPGPSVEIGHLHP